MEIYNCRKCENEELKYEKFSFGAMWKRDRGEPIWLVRCKQCGEVYQLSVVQCVMLYISLSIVWTVVSLLAGAMPIIAYVLGLGMTVLVLYVVWNELPWKAIGKAWPQQEWKAGVGFILAFCLAIVTAVICSVVIK